MNDEMNQESRTPPPGGPGDTGAQWHQDPGRWQKRRSERKSVAGAAALSCLPGLGQVYCGFYQRGFINALVVAGVIFLLNQYELASLHPFLGFFLAFFWLYNIIDASRCAQAVNRASAGGSIENLPEPPVSFAAGGRVAGAVLVLLGVLFLGVTVFDFNLSWLADWWPLFLIGIGLRMIFQGRQS